MDLSSEIVQYFAESKKNNAIQLTKLDEMFPAWVVRFDDWYGVGIPFIEDMLISEKFFNVRLISRKLIIGNKEQTLLLLTSTVEALRIEFASICAQFVYPGVNGIERLSIVEDPVSWWKRWRELLGNSVVDKPVYSILGEMLALEQISGIEDFPKWSALTQSTHDIEADNCSYEVKSTINRYDAKVTINSQYQLSIPRDKRLKLIFCRFEMSPIGISISDMVQRLVVKGYEREQLEKGLEKYNLEKGCSARLEKYKLLEMRMYNVDAAFPIITSESFKDSKIPEGISQLTYTVELTGLGYENFIDEK